MNQLAGSILIAFMILTCQASNFAHVEIVKVDKMVTLNGAYPGEVSKA